MDENVMNPESAGSLRIGIVRSTYHSWATQQLLDGARDRFAALGGLADSLVVEEAPGSWELPAVLLAMAQSGSFDALVALGVVIRGQTDHFDFIISGVAQGLTAVTMRLGTPVGLGVLTCENVEQVKARCGGAMGNKGAEAMEAAVRTAMTIRRINDSLPARERCS